MDRTPPTRHSADLAPHNCPIKSFRGREGKKKFACAQHLNEVSGSAAAIVALKRPFGRFNLSQPGLMCRSLIILMPWS